MKATLKAFTLSAGLLAIGCGGSDDDGGFPFPTPTSPPVAVNDSFQIIHVQTAGRVKTLGHGAQHHATLGPERTLAGDGVFEGGMATVPIMRT